MFQKLIHLWYLIDLLPEVIFYHAFLTSSQLLTLIAGVISQVLIGL